MSSGLVELTEKYPYQFNYIGIGMQMVDYVEFMNGNYYKNAMIYIDKEKKSYAALQMNRTHAYSLWGMLNPMLYYNLYKASQLGISGNTKGDGFQLGGNAIVNRAGDVIWIHRMKNYNDFPKIEEIEEVFKQYTE